MINLKVKHPYKVWIRSCPFKCTQSRTMCFYGSETRTGIFIVIPDSEKIFWILG